MQFFCGTYDIYIGDPKMQVNKVPQSTNRPLANPVRSAQIADPPPVNPPLPAPTPPPEDLPTPEHLNDEGQNPPLNLNPPDLNTLDFTTYWLLLTLFPQR
jgi:hypothetical protein